MENIHFRRLVIRFITIYFKSKKITKVRPGKQREAITNHSMNGKSPETNRSINGKIQSSGKWINEADQDKPWEAGHISF